MLTYGGLVNLLVALAMVWESCFDGTSHLHTFLSSPSLPKPQDKQAYKRTNFSFHCTNLSQDLGTEHLRQESNERMHKVVSKK